MKGQELAEALQSGRRVYGTLIVSTSPHWPVVVNSLGLDFVFIDTEHIPIQRDTLSWMCRTYGALGLAPIVRIPEPDPFQACMVLDGGASGIIVPYVETAHQVRVLQGAAKLRPLKGRRLTEILDGTSNLELALAQYLGEHNEDHVLIVNIESRPAMEALDEIVAVPGLDGVLIGPHDLSVSLGIPEQYDNPKFDEAVRTIISKARAAGIGAGIHYSGKLEREVAWAKAGANLIVHSSDITAFAQGMHADIHRIRQALGDAKAAGGGGAKI